MSAGPQRGGSRGDDGDRAAGQAPVRGAPPLTTREGWRGFIDAAPHPPPLHSPAELAAMSSGQAEAVEDARLAHHSDLVVVATPTVRQVSTTARRQIMLNRRALSARRGLIVTGAAGTGKSTAIRQLGKTHELSLRHRYPRGGPQLPVVYVTVPPSANPRMLAVEFARFLGLPVTRRQNQTDVTEVVCRVLLDLGCSLILVDEVHNLNLATRAGSEVSDQLKYFSERLPVTFVYAGVDLEGAGLFNGPRGRQIASRFATVATDPFGHATQTQREQWTALVATLEDALRLRHHHAGSLVGLAEYLHHRTAGAIGSLSTLVCGAALDAIISGEEKITKAGMDAITLDQAAENHYAAIRRRRRRRGPSP